MSRRLQALLREIRACRLCAPSLPLGPNPVLRASASARLLIVGQAPGTRVHATSIPWNDASGQRLREWLALAPETFYDERRVAIVPMGFCYPGRSGGGDAPPRPECRATWHPRLIPLLTEVELVLLIGQYAQDYFLGPARKARLTDTVRAWREYAPRYVPLPHPSPRNIGWLKANPWFEREVLPMLRARVHALLSP
ncbi:uracil-DNA glycosylase family protein [Vulcaniibacterium gelatinicum]|uniref:uracil-DNA glycosylase family protein n=1 Tax=Vulcaniibacterium gelatinicum TaxID=2598725 RepID=UPI0011C8ECF9|nr:uracil-DNA glycosylase family protein [Vulcaniibacterium gelatinicum]